MVSDYFLSLLLLASAALGVGLLAWLCVQLLSRLLRHRFSKSQISLARVNRPAVLAAAALAVYFVVPAADGLSVATVSILSHAMSMVVIVAVGWLILMATDVLGELLSAEWDIAKSDNRKERAMLTKFRVMRRVWFGVIVVCTVGAVLMTFPSIRSLGAGLLASAGVAGIVLGIALRPTLETFLASLQVALTEPINIDDVVIVEGEWGRIEEIRPTYVVVRIWDDRRLIVPLTYFIQQPFQNWTRNKAEITGVVTLKLDFATPVELLRQQVKLIVEQDQNYDGRFWNLQVTDCDEKAMTLRILCTASNASRAWDLRCAVREKLITWLQQQYPGSLPRIRASVQSPMGEA